MQEVVTATTLIPVTPSLPTAGAYTAGKLVGGLNTLSGAGRQRLSGVIQSLSLADQDKQDAALDVIFFRDKPTGTFTDGATYNPSAADLNKMVGVVSIVGANYSDFSASSLATVTGVGLGFVTVPATANDATGTLYCALVSRGTPTYTDGHLKLQISILQD